MGREPTFEELGNALLDGGHARAGAVGAHGADLLEQPLGALNDVGLVAEAVDQDILILEQLRVLEQAADLAEEGDGLLVELLRVADVCRDDLLEGEAVVALAQARAELLRLDGELAAHRVLGPPDVGVDVVDGESRHGGGEAVLLLQVVEVKLALRQRAVEGSSSSFWRGRDAAANQSGKASGANAGGFCVRKKAPSVESVRKSKCPSCAQQEWSKNMKPSRLRNDEAINRRGSSGFVMLAGNRTQATRMPCGKSRKRTAPWVV